jgi:hypothetical protein
VCRLSDGGLALIAPIRHREDLTASINALGPGRAIIAPKLMHHLYLGEWMQAYPDAQSQHWVPDSHTQLSHRVSDHQLLAGLTP